jgi:hypothetical protein
MITRGEWDGEFKIRAENGLDLVPGGGFSERSLGKCDWRWYEIIAALGAATLVG